MGLFLPAGTPEKIINLLNSSIVETLAVPDVQKKFVLQGFEAKASSPRELEQHLADEIETYRKVIEENGIKAR